MKFLSLWRPWPWAIFDPIANKGIENRNWMPNIEMIGQQIALHATPKWDDRAITMFLELGLGHFPTRKDMYPHGVIVGVATIDRIVTDNRTLTSSQARWFFGKYGWVLTNRIALAKPVPCKGVQGLRDLPAYVESLVLEQLRAA